MDGMWRSRMQSRNGRIHCRGTSMTILRSRECIGSGWWAADVNTAAAWERTIAKYGLKIWSGIQATPLPEWANSSDTISITLAYRALGLVLYPSLTPLFGVTALEKDFIRLDVGRASCRQKRLTPSKG